MEAKNQKEWMVDGRRHKERKGKTRGTMYTTRYEYVAHIVISDEFSTMVTETWQVVRP